MASCGWTQEQGETASEDCRPEWVAASLGIVTELDANLLLAAAMEESSEGG